jgi:DNA-binding NarL/FixJ family response regulator
MEIQTGNITMNNPIKIMLVEDHPQYRETIAFAMELVDDIELISQFGTAEQALSSFQSMETRKECDLILLDLNLPGLSGIEALPFFRSAVPETKIIILTQSNREADVFQAIRKGAAGYLLKSSSMEQIADAIRKAMQGGAPLDGKVAIHILNFFQHAPTTEDKGAELSKREHEILTLLGEGLIKKEIADQLNISVNTVVTHIAHIYEKLEVNTATAAVGKAYRTGLIPTSKSSGRS